MQKHLVVHDFSPHGNLLGAARRVERAASTSTSSFSRFLPVEFEVNRRSVLIGAAFLVVLVLAFVFSDRPRKVIDAEQVWKEVSVQAARHGLDPQFVFAICFAESSFDANAHTGYARGIMQMSEKAWARVSAGPWEKAWDWRANIAAGTAYLAVLRDILESNGKFTYPNLAAAYRFGIGTLIDAGYDLEKLPRPRNRAYQAIFAGDWVSVAQGTKR